MVDEIRRLELVFSAFDDHSVLSRWRRGGAGATAPEFDHLCGLALDWQARSGGAFNPAVGEVTAAWRTAERTGVVPSEAALAELTRSIAAPRFELHGSVPVPIGDCRAVQFNAIAKGYIVDCALAAAFGAFDLIELSVNAGGDLAHRGSGSLTVAIEDPNRPYDNAAPLTTVVVANAALCTSGSSRRGFEVGDRWFSHVIDPRTAWPVDAVVSVSVVAPDAVTADVVATIVGVSERVAGMAFVESLAAEGTEVAVCIVESDATVWRNDRWRELEVDPIS